MSGNILNSFFIYLAGWKVGLSLSEDFNNALRREGRVWESTKASSEWFQIFRFPLSWYFCSCLLPLYWCASGRVVSFSSIWKRERCLKSVTRLVTHVVPLLNFTVCPIRFLLKGGSRWLMEVWCFGILASSKFFWSMTASIHLCTDLILARLGDPVSFGISDTSSCHDSRSSSKKFRVPSSRYGFIFPIAPFYSP